MRGTRVPPGRRCSVRFPFSHPLWGARSGYGEAPGGPRSPSWGEEEPGLSPGSASPSKSSSSWPKIRADGLRERRGGVGLALLQLPASARSLPVSGPSRAGCVGCKQWGRCPGPGCFVAPIPCPFWLSRAGAAPAQDGGM